MALADYKISKRQSEVLALLRERFAGEMDHSAANYQVISDAIGWKSYQAVRETLFTLRAKGFVTTIGKSVTRPDRWIAVEAAP
jgi:hypothetical protein